MSFGPSAALHPSHTLRCGSRPLTAAGGQGPLDNTAYGPCIFTPYIKPALQSPSFVVDWICRDWAAISSIVLRTFRFAPSLPHLAVWAPPAYGRGWPGSSGQHCLRPMHIHSIHQASQQSPSVVVDWVCRDWAAISSIVLRPSGSLHPSPTCGVVPARLRPRVARVLRTTLLTAHAYPLMHTPACPAASAGAVPQKLSALLPPLALHL